MLSSYDDSLVHLCEEIPMKHRSLAVCAAVALMASTAAQAQTEIQWWHAMSGPLGEWVNDLAKQYNESQKEYKVVPTFKGTYDENMTAAIAAFRAGNAPHILQVYEVGTATMMASQDSRQARGQVMQRSQGQVRPQGLHPRRGRLLHRAEWPDAELPVQQLDNDLLLQQGQVQGRRSGLRKSPRHLARSVAAAAKLKANGEKCPFTTSWISWTQLESFSTWHNTLFATKNNGFGGTDSRLAFNSPLHLRHFENLANMSKQGLFIYKGRANAADVSFPSGECAMITGSSGLYARVSKEAKFAYGISQLPYYPDVAGAPQNTIIGGASLWVMSGKKPVEYKGVADFFAFLSQPEVQSASHKRTGYLPITLAAFEMTEKSGFYKEKPGTDVAVTQMIRKTTDKSRGIRLGNFNQIRTIIDEETEQIWAGKKSAKEALDTAVKRGNEQLERFQKANKS
jgi:sn-glycerol 3-phosphate transport system substrate-binding protein